MEWSKKKHYLQKTTILLQAEKVPSVEPVLRGRLEKWGLPTSGRQLATRAMTRARTTFRVCQPRVGANLIATWLNRWPTSRRVKGEGGVLPCRLCGQDGCEDSLRHIPFCVVTQRVAVEIFNLPTSREAGNRQEHLERFLCLHGLCGAEELRRRAIFLQVMYYLYLAVKHGGPVRTARGQLDMARVLLARATRGKANNGQVSYLPGPASRRRRRDVGGPRGRAPGVTSSRP